MATVILPTYNEYDNLKILLPMLEQFVDKIIIIDYPLRSFNYPSEKVVYVPYKEKGLGKALYKGLSLCNDKECITMDADLQHDPKDIPNLLKALTDNVTLVIGSRFIGKMDFPFYRKVETKIFNSLMSMLTNIKIKDKTSGFRVYSERGREIVLEHCKDFIGFDFQLCSTYFNYKYGKIVEVPINFSKRKIGKSKLTISEQIRELKALYKLKWGNKAISF